MKQSNPVCRGGSAMVSAKTLLYKLCGSGQSSIIQGSDGAFYVVKFNGFPGPQRLANEVVGTELIRALGLPVPDWAVLEISNDFLDENPGSWFSAGSKKIKPQQGFHFGSRLIEAPEDQCTYQMIPHSWVSRIQNRQDFLGVLVLDMWANNCDRRQAVFLSCAQKQLYASFIDNDSMFGGKFGFEITCPRRAMVYDLNVYRGLWNRKTVEQWVHRINGIGEEKIREIVDSVPSDWATQGIRMEIIQQLRARRALLPNLLLDAESVLDSGYSVQYNRPRYATEPSQFCPAPVFPGVQR